MANRILPTYWSYLSVLCGIQNKQRLFPYNIYNRDGECLLRGTDNLTLYFDSLHVSAVWLQLAQLRQQDGYLRFCRPEFDFRQGQSLFPHHLSSFNNWCSSFSTGSKSGGARSQQLTPFWCLYYRCVQTCLLYAFVSQCWSKATTTVRLTCAPSITVRCC